FIYGSSVYVAESGRYRVQKLTLDGYPSSFSAGGIQDEVYGNGLYGWASGTMPEPERETGSGFFAPYGVYVNASTIFTVDQEQFNIQLNNMDGSFIREMGTMGSANSNFLQPGYITADSSGNIYITDSLRNDVQKFTSGGNFILKFGSPGILDGQFNNINGIAVNSLNEVFVADTGNHRIQVFTTSGSLLGTIKKFGFRMEDLYQPVALAIDPGNDNIVLTDGDRIKIFTRDGRYITGWGQSGKGNGEFNNPKGIFVDSRGWVYVADTDNNRIQVFAPR
ncbi:MAG: NHL repeat-containing protein, partial [Spirochaetes bacterium]|nr:NHL repeat-containing protein [Spirochaetota bacterium]